MVISRQVAENIESSKWIRKMFEEGARLKAHFGEENVFDFSLGNPDLEPPEEFFRILGELASSGAGIDGEAREGAHEGAHEGAQNEAHNEMGADARHDRSISQPRTSRIRGAHGYMPNAGFPSVREAVSRRVSLEHGMHFPPTDILMTAGAAAGINILFKTILDPGDEVLVVRPFFPEYRSYVAHGGGRLVTVDPAQDFLPDPEKIRAALTTKTAALIINSPNNPTGKIWPRESLEAVARVLLRHGESTGRYPCIVSDEPYREIVFGGRSAPSPVTTYDRTVIATSWSKTLSLAGERIGYLAVSPRFPESGLLMDCLIMTARTLGYINAPALMQRTVARLLDHRVDVGSYARRARLLADGLRSAGYEFQEPEGAFYLFCKVPPRGGNSGTSCGTSCGTSPGTCPATASGPEELDFLATLASRNILTVPGSGFGYPGWFRLSFCVPERTITGSLPGFALAMKSWTERI